MLYSTLSQTAGRVQLASFSGSTKDAALAFTGSGTDIYYSFLLRLDNVASMSTSFQGLTKVVNGSTSGIGVAVQRHATDTAKYHLGIHKRANNASSVTDSSIQGLDAGTVYLIVVKYETLAGTDVMKIWINPAASTLGGSEPTATFSSTAGTDTAVTWNSFQLFPSSQVTGFFDELRLGTSWLDVTTSTTSVGLSSSLNPSTFGDNVTFTATVTGGATPTGTVQFKDGGSNLGSPVALNGSGVATYSTTSLSVGTHAITASYSGDAGHAASSGAMAGDQVVNSANTAPVAQDLTLGVAQGDSQTLLIIGGKRPPTDADDDSLTVSAVQNPSANGAAVSTDGASVTVNYSGVPGFSGSDTFTYTVDDGNGGTDTAIVTVTVSPAGAGANITGISGASPTLTITAQGIPNAAYQLQYTTNLTIVNWQDVGGAGGSATASATTGTMTFTDVNATNTEAWYRTRHVSGP